MTDSSTARRINLVTRTRADSMVGSTDGCADFDALDRPARIDA